MSLPWPLEYSAGGAERARMRRIVNQVTKPAIRATPITPPITPPAITPVSDPPLKDDLGVTVDWPLLVEVGTIEALPVTSGDSVAAPKIHKRCGSVGKNTHGRRTAPAFRSRNRTAGK